MEEYHRLKEKVCTQATQLHQKLESVQRDQRLDEESLQQCKQRASELQAKRQQLVDQRIQLQNRLDHLDSYLETNIQNLDQLKHEKESIEREVSQANLRCKELNEVMERINDDLKDARVDRHESSRSQRKAENLDSMKRLFPGVYGRVIELTEPIHRKYAVALTKVLGKNMDAIIVDTENTGKECIQYLKEMRAEPETFLPLNTIKAKTPKEMLRKLGGTSKLLIDAIKWDPPEIKRALQFACGSAIVCDTMEEARKIAFMSGDRERKKVVSLDGTLFQKSGVISGGASEIKSKAKRWDEKQIDILKRNQERYLEEFKELTRVKRKGTNITDLETRIFGLESRLKYTQKDRDATFNESMPHNQQELESTDERLAEIAPEECSLGGRIEQRNKKLENIQTQIHDVEDSVFSKFCKNIGVSNIRQYEEKELRSQQERSKKKLEFSNQISRLQNQLQYEKNRSTEEIVTKLQQQIQNEENSIGNLKKEEKKCLKIIDKKDDELKDSKAEREEKKKEMDEHETSIKDIRKSLTQTTKDIAAVHKQITIQESELESKRAERHNILKDCKIEDIKLPLLEGEIESIDTDIPSSQGEALEDNMDVDLPSSTSQSQSTLHHILKKELNIKIDFSQLNENLKEVRFICYIRTTCLRFI
ncbi:Structural maintenance of chromosomes protein 1A [Oopsacas minuta]|uniref:Structural maintenance of chromosomes protein 1A n=1 Tax=Oopsacas minuta TaxID=111878 RepID=A0AAV7KH64_9METZ|nr:Structural maintenance of chromosomes protein 1A [Oopsacas minuta]